GRQQLNDLRIPLLGNRRQLLEGPLDQVGSAGRVDGDLIIAPARREVLTEGSRRRSRNYRARGLRRVAVDYINLAVEGVAEIIAVLGAGYDEKQVSVFANRAAWIENAHAVLPASRLMLRPRVHLRNELPATLLRR